MSPANKVRQFTPQVLFQFHLYSILDLSAWWHLEQVFCWFILGFIYLHISLLMNYREIISIKDLCWISLLSGSQHCTLTYASQHVIFVAYSSLSRDGLKRMLSRPRRISCFKTKLCDLVTIIPSLPSFSPQRAAGDTTSHHSPVLMIKLEPLCSFRPWGQLIGSNSCRRVWLRAIAFRGGDQLTFLSSCVCRAWRTLLGYFSGKFGDLVVI